MSGTTRPQIDETLVLDGAFEPHSTVVNLAAGEVVAYTGPDPDHETENEDSVALIPYGPAAAVLVVADGAGGLPAGKRASLTAVNTLAATLHAAMTKRSLLRTAVLSGIDAANLAVLALGNGSATTMTVIAIEGRAVRPYQIGDSEAIVFGQRGYVSLQTTPHSPTGFAVEAGFLDQRAALYHAERHLVSNFIGTTDMRIDVGAAVELKLNDTVMLASDGLMDNVHVDEIIAIARKGPLVDAARSLVELAATRMRSARGGQPSKPDDLSLILYRNPKRRKNA